MSDPKIPTRYNGVDRRAPRDGSPPGEPYKPSGRHSAITNSLYSWHSYKNWAERMRGSWDDSKK